MKSDRDKFVLFAVLLFYAAMDGWRDAWIGHSWWEWHLVKWAGFFSLPVYVLWSNGYLQAERWKVLLPLAATCYIVWELFYAIMQ